MPKPTTYQERFISGVKYWMADQDIATTKEASERLGIGYMALYKLLDGTNKPTADVGILLCEVAGYSANWLFLGKGEMLMKDQTSLEKILAEVRKISKGIMAF